MRCTPPDQRHTSQPVIVVPFEVKKETKFGEPF
jgi:hypothetical protein